MPLLAVLAARRACGRGAGPAQPPAVRAKRRPLSGEQCPARRAARQPARRQAPRDEAALPRRRRSALGDVRDVLDKGPAGRPGVAREVDPERRRSLSPGARPGATHVILSVMASNSARGPVRLISAREAGRDGVPT